MWCIIEFLQINRDGQRELIDRVRHDVNSFSQAKTLAEAMIEYTIILGRIADIAVIKRSNGKLICEVVRTPAMGTRAPSNEGGHTAAGSFGDKLDQTQRRGVLVFSPWCG